MYSIATYVYIMFLNLQVVTLLAFKTDIRPPRAPWGPLDSGLMQTDGRTEPFSPLFKNGHKKDDAL